MGEGFPLWSLASMAWEGPEPLRDWICLSVSAIQIFPFHRFLYSRRSVTPIGLKPSPRFFSKNQLSCGQRRVATTLRGAHEGQGRPLPRGPIGHRLALISLPKIHIYSKKISISFYPIWTPFDMGFLRNIKHATDRNWHWALDQYVSPKNSIKSCQKYVKVVEYWHGTIKNYRYNGDVSRCNPSFTRCNLYLNMVLNAIYYFPVMYGYPMMFE